MSGMRGKQMVQMALKHQENTKMSKKNKSQNEVSSTTKDYNLRRRNKKIYSNQACSDDSSEMVDPYSPDSSDNYIVSESEESNSAESEFSHLNETDEYDYSPGYVETSIEDLQNIAKGKINILQNIVLNSSHTTKPDNGLDDTKNKSHGNTDNEKSRAPTNENDFDSVSTSSNESKIIPYINQIYLNSDNQDKDNMIIMNRTPDEVTVEKIEDLRETEQNLGFAQDPILTETANFQIEKENKNQTNNNPLLINHVNKEILKKTDSPIPFKIKDTLHLNNNNNIDGTIVNFGKIVKVSFEILLQTDQYNDFLHKSTDDIEYFENNRPWTKKTTCPYCFNEITHFPRHLVRNHGEEGAVRQFSAMKVKDPKRKTLLDAIRRQGNYFLKNQDKVIRPVRRPKKSLEGITTKEGEDQYVACQDCLGFFKRDFLRRHRKICKLRSKNRNPQRENHLTDAQLATICAGAYGEFYNSLRLKEEVFIIMRADERSKVAMQDVLICSYAEGILRKHKRTQIRTTVSNKMRELGRLLLVLRETTGVQRLIDILKPEFFDNIVSATKIISGYDPENRSFKASSLALHMGTTLKQVCDTATKLIIKKCQFLPTNDSEKTLKSIKRIRGLIENHWNSEVSSLALKDLNEKKWEKPKLLPLTSDVMDFQKHIMKEAKEACDKITEGKEIQKQYRTLSENVLALTLLLNRKRIGEIQYLKLKTYNTEAPLHQQEEFVQTLSKAEKILTKNFKRVITGGKGSKPVAILFPKNIQKFIDVMLSVRSECVSDANEYLFGNPLTENKWLSGYHVLKKLACQAGIKNQELITSTRLRKQIAIVLQLLNMTDTEMEQFAAFMGHTRKTHEEYYRLPQDLYQTAKVSKLLLAINKGQGGLYKGKTLDEIELSDNVDTDEESDSEKGFNSPERTPVTADFLDQNLPSTSGVRKTGIGNLALTPTYAQLNNKSDEDSSDNNSIVGTNPNRKKRMSESPPSSPDTSSAKRKIKKSKIQRVRWTDDQKRTISKFFAGHIKNKKAPKKHEVEQLMEKHKGLFKEKNWVKIKAYVYNCYKDK